MKCSIVLNEQFKNRKSKRAVEHSPFLKKIAACEWVSEWDTKTKKFDFWNTLNHFIFQKIYSVYTVEYLRL